MRGHLKTCGSGGVGVWRCAEGCPKFSGGDHCPACRIARELAEHRDSSAGDWSIRRATLNFSIIVSQRACPAWVGASE